MPDTAAPSRRRPVAPGMVVAVILLGMWAFVAIAGRAITPHDPDAINVMAMLAPPDGTHWFGTDQVGRDVFSRVLVAARIDLFMCIAGVLPPLIIGTTVGLVSGYFGGMVDTIFMRIYDLTVAFPFFVLVLAIIGVLGPGLMNFIIALTLVGWVSYARIVRAQVLTVRESEYVQAARCLGFPSRAILARHVLPNAFGPVIAYAVSDAVLVMMAGASFGFLGMGVQPPRAEWGVMIADGQTFVTQAWWIVFFPGLALISLGVGFALLGDGLGRAHREGGGA